MNKGGKYMFKKLPFMACLVLSACSSMQSKHKNGTEEAKVEMIVHARNGQIQLQNGQGSLRMMDADKNVSLLSLPPNRKAHVALLSQNEVQKWNEQFGASAPNATLFYFVDGQAVTVPVKLNSVSLDSQGNLSFNVESLDSKNQSMSSTFKESSLFIDSTLLYCGPFPGPCMGG